MGYIEKVLQPGETVRYRGRLSRIVFVRPALLLLVGVIVAAIASRFDAAAVPVVLALAGIAVLLGLLDLARKALDRWGTEITVTDQRVVIKTGLVRRRTIEMNLDRIESVDVSQGIVGRLFNFGDIMVRGTGAGIEPLSLISRPLEFRRSVLA